MFSWISLPAGGKGNAAEANGYAHRQEIIQFGNHKPFLKDRFIWQGGRFTATGRYLPQSVVLGSAAHQYAEPRTFGFLGELRVNVLKLNLALDGQFPGR